MKECGCHDEWMKEYKYERISVHMDATERDTVHPDTSKATKKREKEEEGKALHEVIKFFIRGDIINYVT